MRVALDTNVISQYLAGKGEVVQQVNMLEAIVLPYFVVAELLAGYQGGNRATENIAILEEFLAKDGVTTLDPPTDDTRIIFARLYGQLKKSGKMVSIIDIWIASECITSSVELFSYDNDMDQIQQLLRYTTNSN